jgi:hypothetical protein
VLTSTPGTADEEGAVLAHARRDVPERHRLPVRADRPCNTFIIADYNGATGIIRNCKAGCTPRLPVRADRPCNTFIIADHDGATGLKLRAAQVQPVGRRRAARRGARRLLQDVRLVEGGHGGFRGA